MADRAINSLPTKTAPTSGDKMLMIGAAEEYQIDYDQLATAILNKLSTQSFNSLDTTAKTILGGINELNSKRCSGDPKYNIDYNSLPSGFHYCVTGCTNAPVDYCRVICLYSYDSYSGDALQVGYGMSTGKMYLRRCVNNEWTEWDTFSADDAVQTNTQGYMFSASGEYGADCNDITQPGLCKKVVTPSDGNSPGFYAYLFVFKYTGSEGEMVNLTQVAFPYNSNNAIKCRYRSAGVWSEWF